MKKILLLLSLFALGNSAVSALDIKVIPIAAEDLVYVPSQQRIYASVPYGTSPYVNRIVVINPAWGTIDTSYFIGSAPGPLAVSDNDQYLYVGLNGTNKVIRFNLLTKSIDQQIDLGTSGFNGPHYAEEIEVMPGMPQVIAVSRRNNCCSPRHEGVAIFDNGVQRALTTQVHTGSNSIAVGAAPDRLYGYNNETTEFGLRVVSVAANGAQELDVFTNFFENFNVRIEGHGASLYSSNGRRVLINGDDLELAGSYLPTLGFGFRAVESDPFSNKVYLLGTIGISSVIHVFDRETYTEIGQLELPVHLEAAYQMINWGAEGHLALTGLNSNQAYVVILRECTSLVSEPPSITNGASVVGCQGQALSLEATGTSGGPLYWSNGQLGASASVQEGGWYAVAEADTTGCLGPADSVMVLFDSPPPPPFINAPANLNLCQGGSLLLEAFSLFGQVLWSNGATTPQLTVTEGGAYSAQAVSPVGCLSIPSGSVVIQELPFPAPPTPMIAGDDTTGCFGESLTFSGPPGYAQYFWSNGQMNPTIAVDGNAVLTLTVVTAQGCPSAASVPVEVNFFPAPPQPIILVNGNLLASTNPFGNQWFFNGQPIPGATDQFYSPGQDGFYSVQTTVDGCVSPLSDILNFMMVGAVEPLSAIVPRLTPNPARDLLTIDRLDALETGMLELVDAAGVVLRRAPFASGAAVTIPVRDLPAGYYLVVARDAGGRLRWTGRVAIVRAP